MSLWYAVQKESTDSWDAGSNNYGEAIEMLRKQGEGMIAVINEDTGVCVDEIMYQDIFD